MIRTCPVCGKKYELAGRSWLDRVAGACSPACLPAWQEMVRVREAERKTAKEAKEN